MRAWQVAGYLSKICEAYEGTGRSKAQVFVGHGMPGDQNVAIAEWTQERIEPNWPANIPAAVGPLHRKMMEMVTDYSLEFFELVTPEKLAQRGLDQPAVD